MLFSCFGGESPNETMFSEKKGVRGSQNINNFIFLFWWGIPQRNDVFREKKEMEMREIEEWKDFMKETRKLLEKLSYKLFFENKSS